MELATRRPEELKDELTTIGRLQALRVACGKLSCNNMDKPQCPLAFNRETASQIVQIASGCSHATALTKRSAADGHK